MIRWCLSRLDLDNVYGLFFISIIVLLLVVLVNNLLSIYDSNYEFFWTSRDLENKAQFYGGRIINISDIIIPDNTFFINLDSDEEYGSNFLDKSFSYPVVLLVNDSFFPGRVIVGE